MADWANHYATEAGSRHWPHDELVRALAGRPPDPHPVLDAGCGNGAALWFLAERWPVVGLDGCLPALRAATGLLGRRRARAGLVQADVLRLPFPAGTFGGVVDALTSQHLPWADHGACFREYRRVLRPGGWLFLMHLDDRTVSRLTPLLGDGLPLSGRGTLALFPNAPAVTLTPHWSLCDALLRAGFRLVAQRGLAREYYDHDSQVAHYTVLMAEAA